MTKPKSEVRGVDNIGRRYLATSSVALRYGVSPSTIMRWVDTPSIQFPQPTRVVDHGPNLFLLDELDAHDARRAEQERKLRAERAAAAVERHNQRQQEEQAAKQQAIEDAARAGGRIKFRRRDQVGVQRGDRPVKVSV